MAEPVVELMWRERHLVVHMDFFYTEIDRRRFSEACDRAMAGFNPAEIPDEIHWNLKNLQVRAGAENDAYELVGIVMSFYAQIKSLILEKFGISLADYGNLKMKLIRPGQNLLKEKLAVSGFENIFGRDGVI